jgi:hypothetical protein
MSTLSERIARLKSVVGMHRFVAEEGKDATRTEAYCNCRIAGIFPQNNINLRKKHE